MWSWIPREGCAQRGESLLPPHQTGVGILAPGFPTDVDSHPAVCAAGEGTAAAPQGMYDLGPGK